MMIGCAASTDLSGCDERVRVTAASSGEPSGQRRGDPGAAPPGHGARAAAGQGPAEVPPRRPGVPGRPAAPAPRRRARPVPAAGPACGVPEFCMACELQRRAGTGVRHDDRPCPCACSISSSSGSAAGWSCSAGHRPPRTPSCSCCGTRSPCCAGPSAAPAGLGRPSGPRRADPAPAPEAADAPAGHPRHRPALASPSRRPQVDLPHEADGRRSTPISPC